jgi:hypothetical protein
MVITSADSAEDLDARDTRGAGYPWGCARKACTFPTQPELRLGSREKPRTRPVDGITGRGLAGSGAQPELWIALEAPRTLQL